MVSAPTMDKRDDMLVEPLWLAAHLNDPGLRILDCTTWMIPKPVGASEIKSGRPDYDKGHIPGAQHVDMVTDMSDPSGRYPYTLPDSRQIEHVLSRLGIGEEHRIILYGRGHIPTVTRIWFVLHAMGHRRLAILNGGFERWQAMNLPTSTVVPVRHGMHYRARLRADRVATLHDVQVAVHRADHLLINALTPEQFSGAGGAHYGRPGRIPGSVNVPARELADQDTKIFKSLASVRELFELSGALTAPRVIIYCGGGIAASATGFVLEMFGHPDWAIYDNSLLEWSTLPEAPMETG